MIRTYKASAMLALLMTACSSGLDAEVATPTVTVTPGTATVVVDSVLAFKAVYRDGTGTIKEDARFEWQSSDTAVATIDTLGRAIAHAPGRTTISASALGITGGASVLEVVVDSTAPKRRSGVIEPGPVDGEWSRGSVMLEEREDGTLVLRLADDFRSAFGPRLEVYLSTGSDPKGGLSLGRLKSRSGAQEYEVPSGVTLASYDHVTIYCVAYNVVFGSTKLGI